MSNFYHFNQNNSGGGFDYDDKVCHHVVIEADNADHANMKAESIGIYFDGCSTGQDCPCCGDRWYQASDGDSMDEPSIYRDKPEDHVDTFTVIGDAYCRVYYLDGTVKEYIRSEDKSI